VLTSVGHALRAPVGRLHWASTESATRWIGCIVSLPFDPSPISFVSISPFILLSTYLLLMIILVI
jgi:hypothetical protein